jgi:aryl-alcohol dehydrogenase-like predicted oxidoreductase
VRYPQELRSIPLIAFSKMQTRRIGSLEVSIVGLGCNNFGWRIDAEASAKVIDAAIESGVTFFDTADRYGKGQSEDFLGRALGQRRNQIVLATKFGMEMEQGQQGASAKYVREAVEASLRRLRTDRIDLYQLHQPDPQTPIAETLAALDELVRAGKVREIGCSNFSVAQIREAADASQGRAQFVSVQNEFSLFHRAPETNGVLTECERRRLAFLPYFPLASGLLTGKYRKGKKLPEGSRAADGWGPKVFTEENLAIVESLIELAESKGHTILELAFVWLLSHKPVASVIAGASKPEQVRANVKAVDWQLTADDLAQIDKIMSEV